MIKKVKYLLPAEDINMGGIVVKQALPTNKVDQLDPFLLLHHANFTFNDYAPASQQGIGPHPHRGFTPVTFLINGELRHQDSRGHNQVARQGEVQWMHAGAGIIHSERPTQALIDSNQAQELIQLWINSPADKKMQQPRYQFIKEEEIPFFISGDQRIKNKLIAGNYQELQGKIQTESDLLIIWSKTDKPSSQTLQIPTSFNTMLYLIQGTIRIKGYGKVESKNLVIFENNATDINLSTESRAEFLVLSGVPLNEKTVQHGPFVMNTQTQIMEALRDYQMGKMGILIED